MDQIRIEPPTTAAHVEGYHRILGEVARERRFIALLDAPPLDQAHAFVNALAAGAGFHLVAVTAEDQVVGWCDIVRNQAAGFTHSGRLGMGVAAGWRRRGIGRRLVSAAIEKARETGLTRIELDVFASNRAAIALYASLGFVQEGVKLGARQIDDTVDDVVLMALRPVL